MDASILFVVPTLDSYLQLGELVSSLNEQSSSKWRALFVDGPSSREHRQWLTELCSSDPRYSWVEQIPSEKKIFGAMNQGFMHASSNEWILFWGSDDWAFSTVIVDSLLQVLESSISCPDLIIGRGQYVNSFGNITRKSKFLFDGSYGSFLFRLMLFLGACPPHQATLFGPQSRLKINRYADNFYLAADLNYFLRLSKFVDLNVEVIPLMIVFMSDGGISGQQTRRRLNEVRNAYKYSFGFLWPLPFAFRYMHRLLSSLSCQ